MGVLLRHAKGRGLALGAVALLAIAARLSTAAPPPRSIEGVAEALGRSSGGTVRPDDFLWEERAGFLEETFLGRQVLFLSAPADGAPRDLYRARVRLTRGGRPLSVGGAHNLTHTPDGDDRDLTGAGHHVAFATVTPDGVQGVTLLDLHGAPPPPAFPARALAAVDRWLATGSLRGLGRTEIAFAQAPPEVRFQVAQSALVLSLGPEAESVPAALDFGAPALQTGRTNPFEASAQPVPEAPRRAGEVAAELLERAFGERGAGRSAASALRGLLARAPSVRSPSLDPVPPPGLRIPASYPIEGAWPPSALAAPLPAPFDGEGYWHVAPSLEAEAHEVPPPMVETIVRPDPARPSAVVHLVAIDTRRLDVRILPGAAWPQPTTGPHGSGLLPRGPDAARVVAAFVAGPAPSARPLGFFGEGRLLAPMVVGAPALAVQPDGRALLGPWPESASRDAFVALAQGPDPLADESGSSALAGAGGESFAPEAASARVGRAALCRTKDGYLVHAFTPSASVASLRAGLVLAGCVSAVHLGVSPAPLGLAYLKASIPAGAEASSPAVYTGALASPGMTMPLDALAGPWLQPIAIVTRREHVPSGSVKNAEWTADSGKQPPPAWHPAVFTTETEQLGAKVTLLAFLPDRVAFRLAAGKDESVSTRGDKPGPTAAEREPALAAFGMSVARRGQRRGLIIGSAQAARPGSGAVWLAFDGARVSISAPGAPPPATGDATEVTLVAAERALLRAAREVGKQRPRTALCTLPDGTLLTAHATFDTDEATAEVLLDAGCEQVVSLDRGAHDGVFVHRAGTDTAPEASYEATVLYVLPLAETGTARGF